MTQIHSSSWLCTYEDLKITERGQTPREAFLKAIKEVESKIKTYRDLKIGAPQDLCRKLQEE